MRPSDLLLLNRIQLFTRIPAEEITRFAERITVREFRKGETILHEEETNAYMYVVLQGEVKVFHASESGREAIVAVHGAGDSFGEIALIDQQTLPATVAALEESRIALISRSDFFAIIQESPDVMENLMLAMAGRLRQAWSQIRLLHFKDAAHRVRSLLENLSDERGEPTEEGLLIRVRLTHQSIADMTGLTRETVTRVLDKWKQAGLISTDEQRYLIISDHFFL